MSGNACSREVARTRSETIGGLTRTLARRLSGSSDSPQLDARLLLAHVLGRDRAWLVAHAGDPVDEGDVLALAALGDRRAEGEPLAYLLGEAWFFGRRFVVTRDVLVPRPETEHLVEAALAELRARKRPGARVRACDVGTGSGAIALSLAADEPGVEVVASDCSPAALAVARRNASRLGLGERVRFCEGDLAEPLLAHGPFDCVVANLPYVPTAAVPVRPDPVAFEPVVAVDGGTDGLALYRRLLQRLGNLAVPGGAALFEAAPGTVQALAELVQRAIPRAHVEIGEDYAGFERWAAVTLP